MGKPKKVAPTIAALLNMKTLAGTYGRGGAIIAAAWVDDALEEYLRSALARDAKVATALLQPDGPLGTFGVRIKIAYALGLFSDSVRRDLDIIRLVRNDLAHLRAGGGFDQPAVVQRCRQLQAYRHYASSVRNPGRSARQRFVISALLLAAAFIQVTFVNSGPYRDENLVEEALSKIAESQSFRGLIQPWYQSSL